MNITVNDQSVELDQSTGIRGLLKKLDIKAQKGIAIAVNNEVIPKEQWDQYQFQDQDKVLIIRASQGG